MYALIPSSEPLRWLGFVDRKSGAPTLKLWTVEGKLCGGWGEWKAYVVGVGIIVAYNTMLNEARHLKSPNRIRMRAANAISVAT